MQDISPRDASRLLTGGEATLLDVREPWEIALAALKPALCIPMQELPNRFDELDPARPIIVLCHHGNRSRQVAEWLEQNGCATVFNLTGGIAAWSRDIDPGIPCY